MPVDLSNLIETEEEKEDEEEEDGILKKLPATYSRGVYKTTTIGKTVFDGRVRKGIGSDGSPLPSNEGPARLRGLLWLPLTEALRHDRGVEDLRLNRSPLCFCRLQRWEC